MLLIATQWLTFPVTLEKFLFYSDLLYSVCKMKTEAMLQNQMAS